MSSIYICEHCGARNHSQNILCNDCGRPLLYRQRRRKSAPAQPISTSEQPAPTSSEIRLLNNQVSSLPSRQHAGSPNPQEEIIEIDLTRPETQYTASQAIEFRSNRLQAEDYIDDGGRKRPLLTGVFALLALAVMLMAVMLLNRNSSTLESEHFGAAEKSYLNQSYPDALIAFNSHIQNWPESDLTMVARLRINDMRAKIVEDPDLQRKIEQRVEHYMILAETACKNKQFILPEEDNAVQHIANALTLAPEHPRALQIQGAIIDFFGKKAEVAFERKHYKDAVSYYQAILSITPDHKLAIERMKLLRDYI